VACTLVVSDLHLGSRAGGDVLQRETALDALLHALDGVDRLVLLGDTLELRQGDVRTVLERSRPVFERLAERLGDRPVVLVGGNHDHALVERWLEGRTAPLGPEQRCDPSRASFAAGEVAAMLAPASVEVAYPGLWLADGVYATHGHYLDLHMTVPTIERLAVAVSGRVALDGARRWDDARDVDDYEAVVAPVYAWVHSAAQTGRASDAVEGGRTVSAWDALRARNGGGTHAVRARAFSLAFPWAVRAANAAGLGPLRSVVSTTELRRAGLRAASELVERLRLDARHMIFGHTHRAGRLDGDEAAEWLTPNGTELHNTGSWVFSNTFASDPGSAYWPGTAVIVNEGEPPRLQRLLAERTAEQLRAGG
jgi:hypothetical protein